MTGFSLQDGSAANEADRDLFNRYIDWTPLEGGRVLMTGGTGFIGTWLLEALSCAVQAKRLAVRIAIQTRDSMVARRKLGWLTSRLPIEFVSGDVREGCGFVGSATHFIHGATDASAVINRERPREMFDSIILGTSHALECASRAGVARFLQLSSGAVYGPSERGTPFRETDRSGPDPVSANAAYAEGKRAAEQLCSIASRTGVLGHVGIARCFAFVGPRLPLDAHFAIGNFIRDGLAGGDITIAGDGTAVRSYLHAADLAVWLWNILLRGESSRPYNVGSEQGLTMCEIAETVASRFEHQPKVHVRGALGAGLPDVYLPSTERVRGELGLRMWTSLEQAIDRTIAWHRRHAGGRA
jgi:nucleoside-diphosphate-sugar epimerase